MAARTFACSKIRDRRLLAALAFGIAVGMTTVAPAQAQAASFAPACAAKEIAVITVIEDHGAAGDISAERLGQAGLTMLRARMTCYQGRVAEALTLYNGILDLGPVASLDRQQRP